MRTALLLLPLLVASAHADDGDRGVAVADVLTNALKSPTPADGAATLGAPLRYIGVVFRDRACAKRFPANGTVAKADLARFAACLPSMEGLDSLWWIIDLTTDKPTPRKPDAELALGEMDATVDPHTWKIVRLEHRSAPADAVDVSGIEGGEEVGSASAPPPPPPPPEPRTVRMSDIVGRLRAGSTVVPAETRASAALAAHKETSAIVNVCFGANGDATHARSVRMTTVGNWNAAVVKAAVKLAIVPFAGAPAGQTVCADMTFTVGKPGK